MALRKIIKKSPLYAKVSIGIIFLTLPLIYFIQKQTKITFNPKAAVVCKKQGEISVVNVKNTVEFREENTFQVTVKNNTTEARIVEVVDEIWHDRNCNGIEDRLECKKVGLEGDCSTITQIGGKSWNNVTLGVGESKTLTWSQSGWIPGYCFTHTIYFWSLPLNNTNSCWFGNSFGWQEAERGNLRLAHNQAKFSVNSTYPLTEGTVYGVVTHLFFNKDDNQLGKNLEAFKKDIDALTANSGKIRLVRLAVQAWYLLDVGYDEQGNFKLQRKLNQTDQYNIEDVDKAIDYALSKNFKIILTTAPWEHYKFVCPNAIRWEDCPLSQEKYNQYVEKYFSFLANRWKNKIYIWGIWNENDQNCYNTLLPACGKIIRFTDPAAYLNSDVYKSYLEAFNSALGTARLAIKTQDSSALIMAHAGSYPVSLWYYRSIAFFDKVKNNIDLLAISLYPNGKSKYEINLMPGILDFLRHRYGKPVIVLETGGPEERDNECLGALREQEGNPAGSRGEIITRFLRSINKHALGALIYEMRDGMLYPSPIPVSSECRTYGLRKTKSEGEVLKPSFYAVVSYVENNGAIIPNLTPAVTSVLTPTLTPTPACPAGCTITETRQSAIEKYCKNEGFSCNNGVWADLTCYGGQNSEGCQWVKFKDGPICKDPYCAGCSCITSTPAPPLKKCAEIAADAGVNYSLCSTDFSTGFYCGSTAAICYSQIRVADSSDCVGGQKCRYYNREICNGCDTTKCTVDGCINPAVLPCPSGNPAKNEGNVNCDEKIDNADFVVWRGEFLWEEKDVYTADLNGDNKIDGVDFEIWRENRN